MQHPAAGGLLVALFALAALAVDAYAADTKPFIDPPTDYGRSYVSTAGGSGNQPVFWIESRCRLIDPSGEVRDYYQCGSCKSENTFAAKDLFMATNYDFLPVFADKEAVIFRCGLPAKDNYRSVVPLSPWGQATPLVRTAKMKVLGTPDEIVKAIQAGLPIISQTELRDEETGRRAIIECPIKTMNMNSGQKIYQVDTGPVILPDLKAKPDQWSASLRLAFIAFNAPDWADFIVSNPVPAGGDVKAHHYGERLHFTSRNILLALDDGTLPWKPAVAAAPQIVQENGVTKNRLLPPGPGNPRNSEGDFVQLKDGRILFVYTHFTGGGGDHDAAFIAGRFSSDGGATWTAEDVTIVPQEGKWNVMSASVLRLKSGEIALFYLVKQAVDECRPYLRLSTDEAKSWSEPQLCIPTKGYYVVNNDRVIQLASGRLVIPAAQHVIAGETTFRPGVAMAFVSDDKGRTWTKSNEIVAPFKGGSGLQEPGIIELKNGLIMMLARTDQGVQYRAYSWDGGTKWTEACATDIKSPCSPATFERIPKTGDLLMVWNDHSQHPELGQKRTPLNVAISKDEGQTWERVKEIESDPAGWYCYTALEFVGDRVLLSYCATTKGLGHLSRTQITTFDVDWLYR